MALLLKWYGKVVRWYWGYSLSFFYRVWMRCKTPQKWRDGILISLYKKGPTNICDNYHGISLLLVVGKIFKDTSQAIVAPCYTILPELQCGFRPNWGATDMIFTAWQVQEKQEFYFYQCVINLTKDFGTVHRLMLWSILKIECTEKFTGLIRSLHDSMKAYSCVNGELLEPISSHPNFLVPTLFVIFFAIVDLKAFVIAIPVSISVTVQQESCLTSIVSLQWRKLLWLSFVITFTLLTMIL